MNAMKLVTQKEHFRKSNFSQEIPAPKYSSSSEKVAVGNKSLLQKSTFSE